jgi:hypothetical protein
MSAPAYVGIAAVLERYDGEWSRWQIRELCRTHRFPHRKMPATKRLLFSLADLEAWENGAPLELVRLPDGGRIVRPVGGRP